MHGAACIHRLGDDGRSLRLHIQCLPIRGWIERDSDFARKADADGHRGDGFGKTRGPHGHFIDAWQQIIEAEFSATIAFGLALERRLGGLHENFSRGDASAT
jgi:hypothetical protein